MDIQRIRNRVASFIGGLKKKKRYSSGLDRISPERVNMQINVLNRAVEDALYLPNPDRLKLLEIYINTWKDSLVISEHEKAEAFLITEPFEVGEQGADTEDNKRMNLFSFTKEELDKAVEEGFGQPKWGDPNYEFLQELKYNNAVFAAFKTHRQQNDLAALLVDDEGKQRPFSDFQKASEPVIGSYNSTWLKTGHDTAVKSARTPPRFKEFEKDQDLYPNLKWLKSRAVNPRDSHKPYYNNVCSLRDSWWKNHYPGCVYGCQFS